MMDTPRVLIGSPCGKQPVFDEFYDAFYRVALPEGSYRDRAKGGSVQQNLNVLVQEAVDGKFTHLFIVEDDSTFAPDAVARLLKHDKPVVTGLCRARHAPFKPYVYYGMNENGLGDYELQPTDKGLIGGPGFASGMGGILIRTDVFESMEKPVFNCQYDTQGRLWGQDILFGMSLISAGIPVYIDLDVIIGHATQCVIGSRRGEDGTWLTTFRVDQAVIELKTV
jgi:hypothetical protein